MLWLMWSAADVLLLYAGARASVMPCTLPELRYMLLSFQRSGLLDQGLWHHSCIDICGRHSQQAVLQASATVAIMRNQQV